MPDFVDISAGEYSVMLTMGEQPTAPKQRTLFQLSSELEYWGIDNLEPQHLLKDADSNPVLSNALAWMSRALYAGGLEYGYREDDGDGAKFRTVSIPELDAVLRASNMPVQLFRGLSGLKILGNAFPEFVLSRDRKYISRLSFLDSSFCRWAKAGKYGPDACYVDANWELSFGTLNNEYAKRVPAITSDGFGEEVLWMQEQEGYKFMMPGIQLPSLGRVYYAAAPWATIRQSGWLNYAKQIPKFKEAYLKNATHIKYAVHVPLSWWKWKYRDWDTLDQKKRDEYRKAEHEKFDAYLTGYENAGKSLMLTFQDDPNFLANGYTQWKIDIIDRKVIEGILTNDVLETTQMIHTAVGVDGTLVGNSPGSKMGGGSGSDKREAFNIFTALSTVDIDILTRPLEVMAEYNGFPGVKFRMNTRFMQLLSNVTPSNRDAQDAN